MVDPVHDGYMKKALAQAYKALEKEEVPVGALVVCDDGTVVSRAYNAIESVGCQTAHAEVRAIQKACRKTGNWRLDNCFLYVTLEPCLMCFGLIRLSRLKGVIYGAESPLFGCGIKGGLTVHHDIGKLEVVGGVRERECVEVLQVFFRKARKNKKG